MSSTQWPSTSSYEPEMFSVPGGKSFAYECHLLNINKKGHNLVEFWEAALPSRYNHALRMPGSMQVNLFRQRHTVKMWVLLLNFTLKWYFQFWNLDHFYRFNMHVSDCLNAMPSFADVLRKEWAAFFQLWVSWITFLKKLCLASNLIVHNSTKGPWQWMRCG